MPLPGGISMKKASLVKIVTALAWVVLVTPSVAQESTPPADPSPRETGIVERSESRLVQLDITVSGPAEAIRDLREEDFEVVISGRTIEDFEIDGLCAPPSDVEQTVPVDLPVDAETEATAAALAAARVGATYVFFFDQNHLNLAGRQRALDVTRELIPELITDGNRGMIVSSAAELKTFANLTTDRQVLLEALDTLEADTKQWSQWSALEETRIEEVLKEINEYQADRAQSIARRHSQEEHWRTEKALRRFTMVLGRLADIPAPKAVVYYADTMRRNAGGHYLGFFGANAREQSGALAAVSTDSLSATGAWEKTIDEAAAHGVRLFTVQAEGQVAPARQRATNPSPGVDIGARTRRTKDAQDSLAGFALETGGRHFLNGVRPKKIAATILEDMECIYLLSFDASELPEDRSLPVRVRMNRPKVSAYVRGRLVVRSEAAMLTSRLMAAFAAPDAVRTGDEIQTTIIPTGFADNKYTALVQVSVPGSPITSASWDIGLSLVSRGKVREDSSGRVVVRTPGTPVVFETEMTFAPGPYEIVGVAHETKSDEVLTGQFNGTWPDADDAPATIGPVAVMQPDVAAFIRGSELRGNGSRGLASTEFARTDRPTALISLICRGRRQRGKLRIERALSGDSAAPFSPIELEMRDDRCVQIRDVVRAGTMNSGMFRYGIKVMRKDVVLSSYEHEFPAVDPSEHPDLVSQNTTAD